jgi:hypothetical protein
MASPALIWARPELLQHTGPIRSYTISVGLNASSFTALPRALRSLLRLGATVRSVLFVLPLHGLCNVPSQLL